MKYSSGITIVLASLVFSIPMNSCMPFRRKKPTLIENDQREVDAKTIAFLHPLNRHKIPSKPKCPRLSSREAVLQNDIYGCAWSIRHLIVGQTGANEEEFVFLIEKDEDGKRIIDREAIEENYAILKRMIQAVPSRPEYDLVLRKTERTLQLYKIRTTSTNLISTPPIRAFPQPCQPLEAEILPEPYSAEI